MMAHRIGTQGEANSFNLTILLLRSRAGNARDK